MTVHSAKVRRALLQSGTVAGPLFVGTFLVAGAARDGYDPLRHPVSSLALGPGGWVQTANFAVTGSLYVAYAIGLVRAGLPRAVPVVVGAAGVGLVGAAVFVTDPVSGYPPGTPDRLESYSSATAALHDISAIPVFVGIPAAMAVAAWAAARDGDRTWATVTAGSAVAMLGAFGLSGAAFSQAPALVELGGLFQRISIVTGLGWLTAVAVRANRR